MGDGLPMLMRQTTIERRTKMKRIVVYWKDDEPEQIILGTAREIKSLHNNLIKRYWSLYCTEPFAHPMTSEERAKMYGISLYDLV